MFYPSMFLLFNDPMKCPDLSHYQKKGKKGLELYPKLAGVYFVINACIDYKYRYNCINII